MAGPVASLLLREPLTNSEIADLDGWLREIGRVFSMQKSPDNKCSADFCVDKLTPFTRNPEEPSPLFTISLSTPEVGREFHCECPDETSLLETFGYKPKEHIDISAGL